MANRREWKRQGEQITRNPFVCTVRSMSANRTRYKSLLEPRIYEDGDNRKTLINAGSTWENSRVNNGKGGLRLVESVETVVRRRRAHKIALNSKRIAGPINLFAISAALHVSAARIGRTPTPRINAVIRNEAPMTARREKTALARGNRGMQQAEVSYRGFCRMFTHGRKYPSVYECFDEIVARENFNGSRDTFYTNQDLSFLRESMISRVTKIWKIIHS